MAAKGSLRFKVAGAQQQDVGQGIVRVGLKQIRSLGLERGDVIEIKGKRVTAAIAVPAYSEDEGIDECAWMDLSGETPRLGSADMSSSKRRTGKRQSRP